MTRELICLFSLTFRLFGKHRVGRCGFASRLSPIGAGDEIEVDYQIGCIQLPLPLVPRRTMNSRLSRVHVANDRDAYPSKSSLIPSITEEKDPTSMETRAHAQDRNQSNSSEVSRRPFHSFHSMSSFAFSLNRVRSGLPIPNSISDDP
jgi:hypothetical protein